MEVSWLTDSRGFFSLRISNTVDWTPMELGMFDIRLITYLRFFVQGEELELPSRMKIFTEKNVGGVPQN